MPDLTAERDAEYVRHAGPVLVTYTRQVLMEVDLLRLRKAAEASADEAKVAWLDAMEAATFTVRHPLRERLDDALMTCQLHEDVQSLAGPPVEPGRYRATKGNDGWVWVLCGEGS